MQDASLGPAAKPGTYTPIRVSWAGNPWSLTGLCFINILLIVLTLGIYWFWARSEYRRRMWQMVRVNGEPLEYTGTGGELIVGYLKLFFFVMLPAIAVIVAGQVLLGPKNPLIAVLISVLYIGFFLLLFAGIYRANRYILTRTRWRGIAFGLEQGAIGYAWLSIWSAFLTGLTLFWILPWRVMALRRRLTENMRFGSLRFRFEGSAGALYGPFALVWMAAIPAVAAFGWIQVVVVRAMIKAQAAHPAEAANVKLGWEELPQGAFFIIFAAIPLIVAALCWFEARKLSVLARATKLGRLEARLDATSGSIFWLIVSNALILMFSFSILRPVTQARRLRYLVSRFAFEGSADLGEVLRVPEDAGTQGAGMEAAFSIEIF
jgi:uncharacterized membrane protein YjgN (DUF898 family)